MKKAIIFILSIALITTLLPTFTIAAPGDIYIIRNTVYNGTASSNGTFSLSGGWKNSNGSYNCNGETDVSQIVTQTAGSYAQFNFLSGTISAPNLLAPTPYTGVAPGFYDVLYFHPQKYDSDTTVAEYSVYHNNETSTLKPFNTKSLDKAWHKFFSCLEFSGDGSEYFRVTAGDTAFLRVGAVKLVEVDPPLVSRAGYEDGNFKVVVNGKRLSAGTSETMVMFVAQYTEDNKLVNATSLPITVESGSEDKIESIPCAIEPGNNYKVFVFNNLDDVKPLIASYPYNN